jgi:hypothetical protein
MNAASNVKNLVSSNNLKPSQIVNNHTAEVFAVDTERALQPSPYSSKEMVLDPPVVIRPICCDCIFLGVDCSCWDICFGQCCRCDSHCYSINCRECCGCFSYKNKCKCFAYSQGCFHINNNCCQNCCITEDKFCCKCLHCNNRCCIECCFCEDTMF